LHGRYVGPNADKLLVYAAPRALSDFAPGAAGLELFSRVRVQTVKRGGLRCGTPSISSGGASHRCIMCRVS
jgi:hypothetical protein